VRRHGGFASDSEPAGEARQKSRGQEGRRQRAR
jgi:hypothetical protein